MPKSLLLLLLSTLILSSCSSMKSPPPVGHFEVVAELPFNPGNITVCPNGKRFVTVHQFREAPMRLVELLPNNSYKAFPNKFWNRQKGPEMKRLVAPLGLQCDVANMLWVIDNGGGGTPKLLTFNTEKASPPIVYAFEKEIAPPKSFVQDLAVDNSHGFLYFADIGGTKPPALISLNMVTKEARRFEAHPSLSSENVDLNVEGRILTAPGGSKPARIGVNPITLSKDNKTLFFGAMNGTKWYSVPTKLFRENASDKEIAQAIQVVGPKPVSDGASTDHDGNHYFTAVNENAIVMLTPDGKLETLVKNDQLIWPDALSFDNERWLYVAINQLNRAAPLNNGEEQGVPPYLVARIKTHSMGTAGR